MPSQVTNKNTSLINWFQSGAFLAFAAHGLAAGHLLSDKDLAPPIKKQLLAILGNASPFLLASPIHMLIDSIVAFRQKKQLITVPNIALPIASLVAFGGLIFDTREQHAPYYQGVGLSSLAAMMLYQAIVSLAVPSMQLNVPQSMFQVLMVMMLMIVVTTQLGDNFWTPERQAQDPSVLMGFEVLIPLLLLQRTAQRRQDKLSLIDVLGDIGQTVGAGLAFWTSAIGLSLVTGPAQTYAKMVHYPLAVGLQGALTLLKQPAPQPAVHQVSSLVESLDLEEGQLEEPLLSPTNGNGVHPANR